MVIPKDSGFDTLARQRAAQPSPVLKDLRHPAVVVLLFSACGMK